jgi:DNA gyrase/topoisomerase IV subunit B
MSTEYDAARIEVLEGLEPVRRRPGMYIGSTDAQGLEHLLFEVIGNGLDEHLAGRATRLQVEVGDGGWVVVEDNGSGIDLTAPNALERIFRTVHLGATLDGHHPHVHVTPTLHGAGFAVVNALSARFELVSHRDGVASRAAWVRGVLVEPLARTASTERGTRVRFLPDAEIFQGVPLDLEHLVMRFTELGWLLPRLDLRLQGRCFQQPAGVAGWVLRDAGEALVAGSLVEASGVVDDVQVELAFAQTRRQQGPAVRSFVNYRATEGGSHASGLLDAVGVHRGLVAVVHVGLLHPRFKGPVRAVLETEAARVAVETVATQALRSRRDHS